MRSETATPVDAEAVAELLNAAHWGLWPQGWAEEAEPRPDMTTQEVAAMISGSATAMLVRRAEPFSMLLGCVAVEMSDTRACTISMLAVAAEFRGTMVARALLDDAEQFAIGWGATIAKIAITRPQDDVVAWFERRGYRPSGTGEAYPARASGEAKLPDALRFIVLEKRL